MSPRAGHPALVERRAALRNEFVTPELLAVFRIVTGDVAAMARHLAGASHDHHPVGDERPGGILDEEIAAAIALPQTLAGAGIEPDHKIVPGGEDDGVAVERDA